MAVEELVHWQDDCHVMCPHIEAAVVPRNPIEVLAESLTDAIEADADAVLELVDRPVACNPSMSLHPTIEVRPDNTVTILGVLQAFAAKYGKNLVLTRDEKRAIRFDAVKHYSIANERSTAPDVVAPTDPRIAVRERAAKAELGKE